MPWRASEALEISKRSDGNVASVQHLRSWDFVNSETSAKGVKGDDEARTRCQSCERIALSFVARRP